MGTYVVIVQLTALPEWLALSRPERHAIADGDLGTILKAHPDCSVRWLDAEAMTAQCSDVMLVETAHLRSWYHLWEELRDSPMFAAPYFRLESIVVGIEDGYVDYEESRAT